MSGEDCIHVENEELSGNNAQGTKGRMLKSDFIANPDILKNPIF